MEAQAGLLDPTKRLHHHRWEMLQIEQDVPG